MATKRRPITRNFVSNLSETAEWALGDYKLYPKPENVDSWELLIGPGLKHPRLNSGAVRPIWEENKGQILKDWIAKFPGTRPSYWWDYDAPRITAESLALLGRGRGWVESRIDEYCEPRKRLGGIGTPNFECLNYVPSFHCGIPDCGWVSEFDVAYYNGQAKDIHGKPISTEYHAGHFEGKAIDPNNPPIFESEASYLKRHGLLQPGEERRLKARDFEPVTVSELEEVSIQ